MSAGFWAIPDVETLRTPASIFREQATALTEQTKGLLEGEVSSTSDTSDAVQITLSIKVPALNNYRYNLLAYRQPVAMYPGILFRRFENTGEQVNSEQDLIDSLRTVLQSDVVRRIVGSLLAQARELA